MSHVVKGFGLFLVALLALMGMLAGCSGEEKYEEGSFVGKWQSSRTTTPVYLYDNGEWEMKSDDGVVLQYGVWQLTDNKMMWTVRVDERIVHDLNPILSVAPKEFKLREKDKSVTTFTKLE